MKGDFQVDCPLWPLRSGYAHDQWLVMFAVDQPILTFQLFTVQASPHRPVASWRAQDHPLCRTMGSARRVGAAHRATYESRLRAFARLHRVS